MNNQEVRSALWVILQTCFKVYTNTEALKAVSAVERQQLNDAAAVLEKEWVSSNEVGAKARNLAKMIKDQGRLGEPLWRFETIPRIMSDSEALNTVLLSEAERELLYNPLSRTSGWKVLAAWLLFLLGAVILGLLSR